MAEVARIRTPLSELELLEALRDGHRVVFGVDPSASRLAVAWAQCALEHARGKALDGYDLGNVTCGPSWQGDYYTLACDERVSRNPDVWKRLTLRFRSFAAAEEGAASYWRTIAGRYVRVLAYFDRADAAGAGHTLSILGWYTALEAAYIAGMVKLEHYCSTVLIDQIELVTEPQEQGDSPDCAGEMRSVLSAADIERALAVNLLSLQRQTSEDPLFACHGDPDRETVPDP